MSNLLPSWWGRFSVRATKAADGGTLIYVRPEASRHVLSTLAAAGITVRETGDSSLKER